MIKDKNKIFPDIVVICELINTYDTRSRFLGSRESALDFVTISADNCALNQRSTKGIYEHSYLLPRDDMFYISPNTLAGYWREEDYTKFFEKYPQFFTRDENNKTYFKFNMRGLLKKFNFENEPTRYNIIKCLLKEFLENKYNKKFLCKFGFGLDKKTINKVNSDLPGFGKDDGMSR